MAVVVPAVAPETCEIVTSGINVNTSKLDVLTPLAKVVSVRVRLRVAVFKFDRVSCAGLEVIDVPGTMIVNVSSCLSEPAEFESASVTVMVTVWVPATVGVPHIVSGENAPRPQRPPILSNSRPAGRPWIS